MTVCLHVQSQNPAHVPRRVLIFIPYLGKLSNGVKYLQWEGHGSNKSSGRRRSFCDRQHLENEIFGKFRECSRVRMTNLGPRGIWKQGTENYLIVYAVPLRSSPLVQLRRRFFLSQEVSFYLHSKPMQTSCGCNREIHHPECFPKFHHNTSILGSFYIRLPSRLKHRYEKRYTICTVCANVHLQAC